MSTRAMIGIQHEDGTVHGVYHHWDGYPAGLGVALMRMYRSKPFNRDFNKLRTYLLEEHTAWSTLVGRDYTLEPGFCEYGSDDPHAKDRPQCYCHGDRHEQNEELVCTCLQGVPCEHDDCEYLYVINELGISVFEREVHYKMLRKIDDPSRYPHYKFAYQSTSDNGDMELWYVWDRGHSFVGGVKWMQPYGKMRMCTKKHIEH